MSMASQTRHIGSALTHAKTKVWDGVFMQLVEPVAECIGDTFYQDFPKCDVTWAVAWAN